MKLCNKCKKTGEFRSDRRNKGGLQGICRDCQRGYQREFNTEWNKLAKVRDYKRNSELRQFWPGNNPAEARAEYDHLFSKQRGMCAICGQHQSELRMALHVDHCHKSGKVRGLLCGHCNRGLGHFRDKSNLIRLAAQFLEAHEG